VRDANTDPAVVVVTATDATSTLAVLGAKSTEKDSEVPTGICLWTARGEAEIRKSVTAGWTARLWMVTTELHPL
jgi:hypothetical protein